MKFIRARRWIGKLVASAIVFQITLAMVHPNVTARVELIVIEVAILGSVLGIDIAMTNVSTQLDEVQSSINIFGSDSDQEGDD